MKNLTKIISIISCILYLKKNFYVQVVFRGSKRVLNNEHSTFNFEFDNKIYTSHLRLRKWLIGLLIFLFVSLIVINTFNTDQFRVIRYGAIVNDSLQGI